MSARIPLISNRDTPAAARRSTGEPVGRAAARPRTARPSGARGRRRQGTPVKTSSTLEPSGDELQGALLARYREESGRLHEVVTRPGAEGSVLVIDRDAVTLCDRRLVAHLAPDEEPCNARVICGHYLADRTRGRCRRVVAGDLEASPMRQLFCDGETGEPAVVEVSGRGGLRYALVPVDTGRSVSELRWSVAEPAGASVPGRRVLSLREVIGAAESYEPARAITSRQLARFESDPGVSVCVLRGELERMDASRIVLNRGLREAVCRVVGTQELTMNEIAIRCERTKRDGRGRLSGETSWLARRLGLAPEGSAELPSPWIHSEVLALIARRGIGVSPCEVELG